ncbi:hypothetical protein NLI96_g2576 [Meripilus lineatus]|uniref:Yeast cell wall synthesis Kre9/Knh1-like N-terminal domain-containing protein n=1 Tax=Meripilus lineatus TaxID=2056292 RepID=A0AAD5YGF6_9APHY|nr:hypothetical protein NLI96_g2576 [Physisporinus lineatus]
MRTFFAIVAFATSALAYQVTSPTNATGWTTAGPNTVSWTRVSTDPTNFTIVLNNQAQFPPTTQVLKALVDGTSATSIVVDAPSGGWVAGSGFQVNLVASAQELTTILAQSGQFTIKDAVASSSSVSGSQSKTTLSVAPTAATTSPTTASSGGALNPSASDTPNPSGTPNGAGALTISTGLLAITALVGSLLA